MSTKLFKGLGTFCCFGSRGYPVLSQTRILIFVIVCVACRIGAGQDIGNAREKKVPHVVFLVSEDPLNYEAHRTIPDFAESLRTKHGLRCTTLLGKGEPAACEFPGLGVIDEADLLIVFCRRLALSHQQMDRIRKYLAAGKPLVGIRTANHAFTVREKAREGFESWPDFVTDVLGCHNNGYGPVEPGTEVRPVSSAANHPVLAGIGQAAWHSQGNLYLVKPVDSAATILLEGVVNNDVEPIAWTRQNGKGRVFYTSLGHESDFKSPQFRRLLTNAIYWALDRKQPAETPAD